MDNTGNSGGKSSNSGVSGPELGAPSTSNSSPAGSGKDEGDGTESSSSKSVFKRPITRNMADYDSDTDTIQT